MIFSDVSPYIGIYLMLVFLNVVIFEWNYDTVGLAFRLLDTTLKKVLGSLTIFFLIPFIIVIYTLLKRKFSK